MQAGRLVLADHADQRLIILVRGLVWRIQPAIHARRISAAPLLLRAQIERMYLSGRQLRVIARPQPLHIERMRCAKLMRPRPHILYARLTQ